MIKFLSLWFGIPIAALCFTEIAAGLLYAQTPEQLRWRTLGAWLGFIIAIAVGVMWP